MSGADAKSRLARNTVWSLASYAVQFVTPIVLMPYIVKRVSLDVYGVYVALFTLAGYFIYYDFGIWGAISRDVADRQAKADRDGLRTLWATWLWFDLVAGSLLVALAVLSGPRLVSAFAGGSDPAVTVPVFIGLAASSVLQALMRHLLYTLQGLQRLDLTSLMALVVTPFWIGGQVLVLEAGWGLRGLMLNGLFFAAFQVVILLAMIARQGYPVTFSPAAFSFREWRRLVRFGWTLHAGVFLNQAFRSDKLVLSRMGIAPSLVAVYQLGGGIMDRLAASVSVMSSGVLPAVSDLVARGDFDRVRLVFMRGTKYHALAAVGLLGFAALFGEELMVFWMGQPLPDSVRVLRIMALGGIATAIGSCGQSVAVALGRPGWTAVPTGIGLAATVFLYMAVGRRYDYVGLAASVSFGLALIQIVFMIGLRGFLEFRWREYVGNALLKPAVLALPLAGVYAGWRALAPHLPPVDGRLRAFLVLAPAFLVAAAIGWAVARAFRVVDDYDVDLLKSPARRANA